MTQSMSHTQQSPKPNDSRHSIGSCIFHFFDRKTPSVSINLFKLSLFDNDSTSKPFKSSSAATATTNFRLISRKRRRVTLVLFLAGVVTAVARADAAPLGPQLLMARTLIFRWLWGLTLAGSSLGTLVMRIGPLMQVRRGRRGIGRVVVEAAEVVVMVVAGKRRIVLGLVGWVGVLMGMGVSLGAWDRGGGDWSLLSFDKKNRGVSGEMIEKAVRNVMDGEVPWRRDASDLEKRRWLRKTTIPMFLSLPHAYPSYNLYLLLLQLQLKRLLKQGNKKK
ncbi:hypothetical protein PIB30_087736 [Stylosanthes scabra]|uniref:Transmembrane protein n=1 Tax=Stylosanthes scabra TaxID=79078 RepID=A0ABU6USE2_9FABA|nr:hypothetical protein [Stylosanthes scabra]